MRIECVPDDEADIASTVLGLRLRVGPSGFVFTSGGIGATHDDVTYSAIASAFGGSPLPDVCPIQDDLTCRADGASLCKEPSTHYRVLWQLQPHKCL